MCAPRAACHSSRWKWAAAGSTSARCVNLRLREHPRTDHAGALGRCGRLRAQHHDDGRGVARNEAAATRQGVEVDGTGATVARQRTHDVLLRHAPRNGRDGRSRARRRSAARQPDPAGGKRALGSGGALRISARHRRGRLGANDRRSRRRRRARGSHRRHGRDASLRLRSR